MTEIAWTILSWLPEHLHNIAEHISPSSWAVPVVAVFLSIFAMAGMPPGVALLLKLSELNAALTHPVKYLISIVLTVVALVFAAYAVSILPATFVYELTEYSQGTDDRMTADESLFGIGVSTLVLFVGSLIFGPFAAKILGEAD